MLLRQSCVFVFSSWYIFSVHKYKLFLKHTQQQHVNHNSVISISKEIRPDTCVKFPSGEKLKFEYDIFWLCHDLHICFQFYTVGNDEEIRPYINTCYSKYASQFGWAIYVMEGALLSFGAFLAWETRHVSCWRGVNNDG